MKTNLFILAILAVAGPLIAAHVNDQAGLLGMEVGALETDLSKSRVFVETLKSSPDLREYANNRISKLVDTNGGFLIVVTTAPRAWRISMFPLGIVSQKTVQKAGDSLVLQFHQSQFRQGFEDAAAILDPPPAKAISWPFLCIGLGGIVFVALVIIMAWRMGRVKPRSPERETYVPPARPKSEEPKPAPEPTPKQRQEAEQVFNRYTPAQRERIVNNYYGSSSYSPGCADNAWLFYYLLLSNDGLHSHHTDVIRETVIQPEPVRHYEEQPYSPPADTSSASYSDSASSDSSGSGGSFDSGSFGGGGDSSGGGGSW